MTDQVKVYENKEFGALQVWLIGDRPYFPAVECAVALGYRNPYKAVTDHCQEDGLTNREVIDRLGRKQEKKYISEGNLYRLIIRSKLPSAERFERWVFDEVLPSIRKHGAYITDALLDELAETKEYALELIGKLETERRKSAGLWRETLKLECKAEYCDAVLQSKNSVPVSLIAKDYGMTAAAFNRLLHDLRIQYRIADTWLLYQNYTGKGYTKTITYSVCDRVAAMHTRWTQAGRLFLYEKLKSYGYLPLTESGQAAVPR